MRETLLRGALVRVAYRLGRQSASGLLSLSAAGMTRPEVFALRRGHAVVVGDTELARKQLTVRLARLAGAGELAASFDGGATGVLPLGPARGVDLAAWARSHLEAQLDSTLADRLSAELAGARITLRPELAPEPADEADRRMLTALAQPRRLDQIWPLARTPRFRLLAFVHFLRSVEALHVEGVVIAIDHRRRAALQLLGIDDAAADPETVKRAYRRLARALHPDLQPSADAARRRALEHRFAEVTAAYETVSNG